MMKTLTVQIGNSDDKLTQREWSEFVAEVNNEMLSLCNVVHFSGRSDGGCSWQNACWVASATEGCYLSLRAVLMVIGRKYKQDSIALTVGKTEMI